MYTRKEYQNKDFLRIRNFLQKTHNSNQNNWLIDRWNFCRYFGQIMHGSYNDWPKTVGLWEDKDNEIVVVVHSEGNRIGGGGEVFFQLSNRDLSKEFLSELLDYAEATLCFQTKEGYVLYPYINSDAMVLKEILIERNYQLTNDYDVMSNLNIDNKFDLILPKGYEIIEANLLSSYERGFAHGKAFGYYKNAVPDDDDAKRSYEHLVKAPDYRPEFDLVAIDENKIIAAFVTTWYDDFNKISILEPVGTVPNYRKQGLAKAVIYEGINRVIKKGVKQIYVGSDQDFYLNIGYSVIYKKEIWKKVIKTIK